MSEPVAPPPVDPAPQIVPGRVLRKVIDGLAKEPVLLFGFATLLVVAVVGQALGGNLLPVGWLLLGIYALTVLAWLAVRHPRKPSVAPPKGPIAVDESKNVRIHDSGNTRNVSRGDTSESKVTVDRSEGVEITGSGNTVFDHPPAGDR